MGGLRLVADVVRSVPLSATDSCRLVAGCCHSRGGTPECWSTTVALRGLPLITISDRSVSADVPTERPPQPSQAQGRPTRDGPRGRGQGSLLAPRLRPELRAPPARGSRAASASDPQGRQGTS